VQRWERREGLPVRRLLHEALSTSTPMPVNPKSLNRLVLTDEGGTVLEDGGDYYVSFSITVAT